jgi:hypothetical protein
VIGIFKKDIIYIREIGWKGIDWIELAQIGTSGGLL